MSVADLISLDALSTRQRRRVEENLALVHITSPYLNHPLGIGVLMALIAMTAGSVARTLQQP